MTYDDDTLPQLQRAILSAVDNPLAASWRASEWLVHCPFDNHGQTMFVIGWLGGIRAGLGPIYQQRHDAPKRTL